MRDIFSAPIPLSVVVFLIAQTMAFVWWGSGQFNAMAGRVSSIELRMDAMDRLDAARGSHEGRIIVLEQAVMGVRDDLTEIKSILREKKNAPDLN